MMPALKVVESSLTIGPISGKASVAKASLVQVSSSSSESNDHHIGHESAPHDASKSLHVAEEEMQVHSKIQSYLLRRLLLPKVSFLFHLCLFLSKT